MRKWWRDSRWVEFWRDVGVLVMAFVLFTIPLGVVFNLTAGSWIAQTEEVVRRSTRVVIALEKQAEALEEMNLNMKHRDAQVDEKVSEIKKELAKTTHAIEGLSWRMGEASEGQSAP